MAWSQREIDFIRALRNSQERPNFIEITKQYNAKFGKNASSDMIGNAYRRFRDIDEVSPEELALSKIKQTRKAQRSSAVNSRVLRNVLDAEEFKKDVLEYIEEIVGRIPKIRPPKPPKKYPKRFSMTIELMLSDLHFGKLVMDGGKITFDEEIARRRMREIAGVFLKELHMAQKHYSVDDIIVALLGDIIESYEMHLLESARGCQYTTSRQIWCAIESIFNDVLVPIAETGIQITVPAVTGNHDRSEHKKTYVDPGLNNWTHIIYSALQSMMRERGYENVSFVIPSSQYCVLDVYGKTVLYEHFDEAAANSQKAIGELMRKRSQQIGRIVDMARGGHWHNFTMYDNIIVNGSLPGVDGFSDGKGFYPSSACQALNFYLDYAGRGNKTPFHKTFGIKLD